jgi:hypothetical protein
MRQCVSGRRRRRQRLGLWAALAVVLAANLARAQTAAAPPPAPVPLAVAVQSDRPDLDPEAVRRAIEDELQSWVVSVDPAAPVPAYAPRLAVDVSSARGELAVRFEAPGRKPLVRVIPMPGSAESALRTIAWLAGNLVRDQSADLLPAAPPLAVQTAPKPFVPAPAPAPPVPAAVPSVTVQAHPVAPRQLYVPITVSLFFPLASNADEPDVRTHLSVNLFYGRIGTLDRGLQMGITNQVTGDAGGLQLGVINEVGGDFDGTQLGTLNRTRGHVAGGQVGLINSAGDVHGTQIGLINVGRNVQGLQLGLINISDDIDGLPIGIINVSATGGIHPVVWTSGTEQVAVGLKFSTRNVYTLFSGATQSSDGLRRYGPGLAVGLRRPMRLLVAESDVGGTYLFGGPLTGVSRADGLRDDMLLASWRAMLGFQVHRHFTVFGGAALTARLRFLQVAGQDVSYEIGPDLFAGVQL